MLIDFITSQDESAWKYTSIGKKGKKIFEDIYIQLWFFSVSICIGKMLTKDATFDCIVYKFFFVFMFDDSDFFLL